MTATHRSRSGYFSDLLQVRGECDSGFNIVDIYNYINKKIARASNMRLAGFFYFFWLRYGVLSRVQTRVQDFLYPIVTISISPINVFFAFTLSA